MGPGPAAYSQVDSKPSAKRVSPRATIGNAPRLGTSPRVSLGTHAFKSFDSPGVGSYCAHVATDNIRTHRPHMPIGNAGLGELLVTSNSP